MGATAPVLCVTIISGRSGVGKSSVAYEVCHQLRQRNFAHVHIEGDNLDAAHPRPEGSELMLANLKAMWRNFSTIGGEHTLILSGTAIVLSHAEIKNVIHEVSGCRVDLTAIILTASDETVGVRLRRREVGTDLESHLRSSKKMAAELDGFDDIPALRLNTDGKSVEAVAEEIVKMIDCSKEWVSDRGASA